jgi:hypothetical protein
VEVLLGVAVTVTYRSLDVGSAEVRLLEVLPQDQQKPKPVRGLNLPKRGALRRAG